MTGETITRRRPGATTNDYGDTVDDWDDTSDLDIEGAAFAPGGSTEQLDGRSAVITDGTLYLRPGVDVEPGDRFMIRGAEWDASGAAADWRHPISGPAGIVIPVRRVIG